jgi:hypothetical protein
MGRLKSPNPWRIPMEKVTISPPKISRFFRVRMLDGLDWAVIDIFSVCLALRIA